MKSLTSAWRFAVAIVVGMLASTSAFPQPAPAVSGNVSYTISYSTPLGAVETIPSYLRAGRGPNPPRVGLVLSGGGARGLAQIGVLRALERAHVPVHLIVGTSIGALVGGLYAAGYTPDELDSIARTTDWKELLVAGDESYRRELSYDQKLERDRSILALQLEGLTPIVPDALSPGKRFTTFVNRLVWDAPFHPSNGFDDLRVPFRAVATDLAGGKRIVFDRGNLADVMRASATAPLRFTPIARDSMLLVDGGLLTNIPTDVARDAGCDYVIVVNTTSSLRTAGDLVQPWDIADQVVTVMMRQQYEAALRLADVEIVPALGSHASSDFSNVGDLIDRGAEATAGRLPAMLAALQELRGVAHAQTDPALHFNTSEIAASDVAIVTRAMRHDTPVLAAFDSLASGGHYGRLSLAVHRDADGGGADLTASPNPEIRRVTILTAGHPLALDSIAGSLLGAPYGAGTVEPVLERMLRWYRWHGFAFGTITGTRFDAATGSLDINVADGRIGSITITGNTRTDPAVIARELPFTVGEPFSTELGVRALHNLNATNIFRQATMEVLPRLGFVDMHIRVTEEPSQIVRLSGKLDNERNTQIGIEIADENLFGERLHVGALLFGGLRNMTALATFSSSRVLTTYLSYNATAYSDRRDVYVYADSQETPTHVAALHRGEYTQERNGLRFSVGENVPGIGLVGVTARYEHQLQHVISGAFSTDARTLFSMRGQLMLDTQDDFPFPDSGTVVNASYETGLKLLGAATSFTKLQVSYDNYFPIRPRHTLHAQFMWGYADEPIPVAEQFRIGGQHTFYGYFEDQYAGNQVMTAGLEYRYALPIRLFFDTYFTARYDIGTVWPRISEIQFGDLRHGLGGGLSFNTPLGPAEFAIGRSFTLANPIGGKHFAVFGPVVFYFSVGTSP